MGWFGWLFGSPKNAPLNMAGATLVVTLLVGGIATFAFPSSDRIEAWKYLTPIITLALGYAFGKKT